MDRVTSSGLLGDVRALSSTTVKKLIPNWRRTKASAMPTAILPSSSSSCSALFPVAYSATTALSSSILIRSSNPLSISTLSRTNSKRGLNLHLGVRAMSSPIIDKETPESQRPHTFLRDSDEELSGKSDSVRGRFEKMIREAQDKVCSAIEDVDRGGKFKEDVWSRPGGGGGISRVLQDGAVWEKAGVNVSVVYGVMPPEAYRAAKPTDNGDVKPGPVPFFAAGISSLFFKDLHVDVDRFYIRRTLLHQLCILITGILRLMLQTYDGSMGDYCSTLLLCGTSMGSKAVMKMDS
ncbi:unnamed protein product [Ilex paraguariensis]|uniref:coproporphyrinogen oxidase n=1 Tax=Ilex paraguariensis TaxID=185542 RepID=A0ABC8UPK9_9AQUA